MAEANPSKGDSGRTAAEQRSVADDVAKQEKQDRDAYDKARLEEVKVESEELGDSGFVKVGGVVRAGAANTSRTTFPGAERRQLDGTPDGEFLKKVTQAQDKLGNPAAVTPGWTAQSSGGYDGALDGDTSQLPGATFTVEELPDPVAVAAAGSEYTIPANLVVDVPTTENLSASQGRAPENKATDSVSRVASVPASTQTQPRPAR